MKRITLILIVFTVFLLSCKMDDSDECFTPPESFRFEILGFERLDKTSRENVFINGTYEPEEMKKG